MTNFLLLLCGLLPFIAYLYYVLWIGQGPVDYVTFMSIGERFLQGGLVYGDNSYYPLPYVMIFAAFRLLPKPFSLLLWLSLPVIVALCISGWKPWVLFFAPLYSHFVGGQSSLFGMLAVWGYRKYPQTEKLVGGIFLAFALLKPQLAIFPTLFAFYCWAKEIRSKNKIPLQCLAWIATVLLLYLPSFVLYPQWFSFWLQSRRPFFERAMVGLVPRLLVAFDVDPLLFGMLLTMSTIILGVSLFHYLKQSMPFKIWMIGSFVINPFIHDYDLIQLIPLLQTREEQWIAVLACLPGWLTILFAYPNDKAWITFTLIAPILLVLACHEFRQKRKNATPFI